MRYIATIMAVALAAVGSAASAQAPRDNSERPCVDVNIQLDRSNSSRTNQNCGINMSRTMQGGENNTAETRQRGDVNDNDVTQFNAQMQRRRPAGR